MGYAKGKLWLPVLQLAIVFSRVAFIHAILELANEHKEDYQLPQIHKLIFVCVLDW